MLYLLTKVFLLLENPYRKLLQALNAEYQGVEKLFMKPSWQSKIVSPVFSPNAQHFRVADFGLRPELSRS